MLHCRAETGIEAPPVTIEVFLSGGLPAFTIVGMAETAVRESKDRVRGALLSSGFEFPQQRITISLGPADMRKAGGRYDLAIALGILAARRQFPKQRLTGTEFDLLWCLAESPGKTVSKDELSHAALGRRHMPYDRSIDTHISNVRGKLTDAGVASPSIQSRRGMGYCLLVGE